MNKAFNEYDTGVNQDKSDSKATLSPKFSHQIMIKTQIQYVPTHRTPSCRMSCHPKTPSMGIRSSHSHRSCVRARYPVIQFHHLEFLLFFPLSPPKECPTLTPLL